MVLRRIFRGVEQRHRVRTFYSADELPHGLRRTQLVGVPAAELLPAVPGVARYQLRSPAEGARSLAQTSQCRASLRTPRGQSLSTSTRQPSSGAGAS